MFLYKVKVSNYKTIKKLEIDFRSNKNGLKKDIVLGKFKETLNGSYGLPGVVAILGRNGVGKTTLIDAITFAFDVFNGNLASVIINTVIESAITKERTTMLANQSQITATKNDWALNLQQKLQNEISSGKGIAFQTYKLEVAKFFANYYKSYCINNSEPIVIEMFFDNNGKDEHFSLSINRDGEAIDNLRHNDNAEFIDLFTSYSECLFVPVRNYGGNLQWPNFTPWKNDVTNFHDSVNGVAKALTSLVKLLGENKVVKIIKLADPNISKLDYSTTYSNEKIVNKVICCGRSIDVQSMSNGTKMFIGLTEAIVRANKLSKGNGLLIIDEIELKLHKELVNSLLIMMGKSFKDNNMQFLITSHNPGFLTDYLTYKQIFSIEKKGDEHEIIKASKIMKPHESIMNKYNKGLITEYPDSELSRNIVANIFNE